MRLKESSPARICVVHPSDLQGVRGQHSKTVRRPLQPLHAECGDPEQHGQDSGAGVRAPGRLVHREQRAAQNPRRRRGGRKHQQHAAQRDGHGRCVAGEVSRKVEKLNTYTILHL